MTDLSSLTPDQLAEKVYGPGGIRPNVIGELVRRASERDQAVRERDEASDALQSLAADHYFARAEAAEAEARRLRDALEKIRDAEYPAMATAARIARSALAAGSGEAT